MNNFIIRYDNSINSMFPVDLTKLEMNAFMYILTSFTGNPSEEIMIPYKALRDVIHYNPKRTSKDFDEVLQKFCQKLQKVTLLTSQDNIDGDYCVFPTFIRNGYDRCLTVGINPHARRMLDISKGYTQFDIREFISLKSKAAKFIFIHLKQFRTTGVWHVGLSDFKDKLGYRSYNNNNCIQKLVLPAIKELDEKHIFSGLTVKVEYDSTQGTPARSLLFTFQAEDPKKKASAPKPVPASPARTSENKNRDFATPKQENVPSESQKSDTELSPIVIDSFFCTTEALLKGRINEDAIALISGEARKNNITPLVLKRCIYETLNRDYINNIVGYIITLIRKNANTKVGCAGVSTNAPSVNNRGGEHNFFTGYTQRTYDYAALERELVNR